MKRIVLAIGLIALLALALPFNAFSAGEREFPDRQIEVVYPWDPGETGYAVAQLVADRMGDVLDQTVTVTSTTGAAGVRAMTQVQDGPADGYTVFDGYVAPTVLAPLQGNADYSWEDFVPLYGLAANGFAIASRPDEDRWDDLPGLLEYANENPGEIRMGSSPAQSLPTLTAAAMLRQADAEVTLVPYEGAERAWSDFQAGDTDIQVITSGLYEAQSDNLEVMVVLNDTRYVEEGAPGDIPGPLITDFEGLEAGLSGLAGMGWTWWVVPEGTPDEAVEVLRDAMYETMSDPDIRDRILDLGFIPLDPEEFGPEDYTDVVSDIESQLSEALEAIEWLEEAGLMD